MQGAFIEDLTWSKVKRQIESGVRVLIPIGAAAKAHGHHLPMQTDYLTARALAQRLCGRMPVLVAPVIGLGYYPAFAGFAGSQSISAATFQTMLVELMALLIDQGAARLLLLNTGVSTEKPVDAAVAEIARLEGVHAAVAHMRQLGKGAEHVIENREGGHADERETSLMLAIAPDLVRLQYATPETGRHEEYFARTGSTGNAAKATAAKGNALLAAMVDDLVALLQKSFG